MPVAPPPFLAVIDVTDANLLGLYPSFGSQTAVQLPVQTSTDGLAVAFRFACPTGSGVTPWQDVTSAGAVVQVTVGQPGLPPVVGTNAFTLGTDGVTWSGTILFATSGLQTAFNYANTPFITLTLQVDIQFAGNTYFTSAYAGPIKIGRSVLSAGIIAASGIIAEPSLGLPASDGSLLTSAVSGARSWLPTTSYGRALLGLSGASGLASQIIGTGPNQAAAGNDSRIRMIYTPEMALGTSAGAAPTYSATVDDTPFIAAAFAASQALTPPGVVRLNRQYRIATANGLTANVSGFHLDGVAGAAGLVLDFASGNGLTLAPATAPTASNNTGLRNCVLRDFTITAAQPMTSGAAIATNWTNNLRVEGVTIGTPTWTGRMNIYDGIVLQNAGNANLTDATQIYAHHYGATWSGSDVGITTFDSYGYGGSVTGNTLFTGDFSAGSIGIAIIGGTGGIILDVGNLSAFENGVVVRQDTGYATNRELFATKNFTVDSNVYNGYVLQAGLTRFVGDVWSCGNGRSAGAPRTIPSGNGYAFLSQIDALSLNLTGSYMYQNGSDGVHITTAGLVTIAGGDFFANGQNGSGSGVYLNSSITNASVVGCNVTANASYGINIPGGGPITAILALNQVGANVAGTIAFNAGNQNIHAFGNTYGQSTNLCLTSDDTTPGTISTWDARHAIIGGGGGNGAAALGVSVTASTNTVNLFALQPGSAFWNLSAFAAYYKFRSSAAGNPGLDIHNDGSLWRVGADGISTPVGSGVNGGSVPYAATITPVMGTVGADLVLDVGALTGNLTIANPTGTPVNRQRLEIHLQQDSTGGRAVTYGTAFKFTAANPATSFPSAANNLYSVLFEFWTRDNLWHAVGAAGPY